MKRTVKIEKGNFLYPEDLFHYMTLGHRAGLLRALKEYRADHYELDVYIDLEIVGTAFKVTLYTMQTEQTRKMNKKMFILLPEGFKYEVKPVAKRKPE